MPTDFDRRDVKRRMVEFTSWAFGAGYVKLEHAALF